VCSSSESSPTPGVELLREACPHADLRSSASAGQANHARAGGSAHADVHPSAENSELSLDSPCNLIHPSHRCGVHSEEYPMTASLADLPPARHALSAERRRAPKILSAAGLHGCAGTTLLGHGIRVRTLLSDWSQNDPMYGPFTEVIQPAEPGEQSKFSRL
jgi:hypothetical protein